MGRYFLPVLSKKGRTSRASHERDGDVEGMPVGGAAIVSDDYGNGSIDMHRNHNYGGLDVW
jgi:hypothetical protein